MASETSVSVICGVLALRWLFRCEFIIIIIILNTPTKVQKQERKEKNIQCS